jgi:ATP-dependent helicase/nuclease subunit A
MVPGAQLRKEACKVKTDAILEGLSEPQRRIASTLDAPLFVEAGAGSGKTFTLTRRIVYALSPGSGVGGKAFLDNLSQALIITFTEAAAREIRERVRMALRHAGMYEAALQVDSAWISTIHGMCSRILHRHALDLGLDPAFQSCSANRADQLSFKAIDEVLAAARASGRYGALFAAYDKESDKKPGGSKTGPFGLIESLYAVAARCPSSFDGLETLVGAASGDTVRKAMGQLLEEFEPLGSCALSAQAASAVRASLDALEGFAALAPGKQTIEAAQEALSHVKAPRKSKAIADLLPSLKVTLSLAQAEVAFAQLAPFAPEALKLARRAYERFGELKRASSVLDNDDLIRLALAALRDHPEVARDFSGRFRLVMVDEFQDTDATQLQLIRLLIGGDDSRLCTVGDAQQSIYRFRGADVGVFRRQGSRLPDQAHVRLTTNFRSHPDVLAFVERVCGGRPSDKPGQPPEALEYGVLDGYLHLDASPSRKDAYRARSLPRVCVEAVTGKGQNGYASKYQSATMAAAIADRLKAYADAGQSPADMALLLGVTTHADLYIDAIRARGLECVVMGGSTFTSVIEVKVMQALLHTLANPSDTQSGLFPLLASEMFELGADDFCLLGTRTQSKLDAPTKRPIERGLSDMEFYGGKKPSRRLRLAHDVLVRAEAEVAVRPVADVCLEVVKDSGWLARLRAEGSPGLSRAANVLASIRYIRDLTEDLGLGPARAAVEFDRWLEQAKVPPASLAGAHDRTVRIMTIHASKGLEFPIVAVAECWSSTQRADAVMAGLPVPAARPRDGSDKKALFVLCPQGASTLANKVEADQESVSEQADPQTLTEAFLSIRSTQREQDQAEKARLLYVALTRAREALVVGLSCASGSKGIASPLAAGVAEALDACLEPGQHEIDYGGDEPCALRVIEVSSQRGTDGKMTVNVDSADSLSSPCGAYVDPSAQELCAAQAPAGAPDEQSSPERAFRLFKAEGDAHCKVRTWHLREEVFSYSSLQDALQEEASRKKKGATLPPRRQRDAEAAGAPADKDADKATNLGSAFHELAQAMVESGHVPTKGHIAAMAAYWHLSARATSRLREALRCWEGSTVRKEALAHQVLKAEQPFFTQAPAGTERFGTYIEGAMDLLCYDLHPDGTPCSQAFLVDYKTGDARLTAQEIDKRHRLQARLYAKVLFEQGFRQVSCRFVCVEVDEGALSGGKSSGQPHVARYDFDAGGCAR